MLDNISSEEQECDLWFCTMRRMSGTASKRAYKSRPYLIGYRSFLFANLLLLKRLIGEDHGPSPARCRREEFQSLEAVPIFEEALSTACNNRVDQEYQLIQKALFEEGADQGGTSGGANVLPWQSLQRSDLLGEISLDQRRVLPFFDSLQGGREDVLGRGINEACKRLISSGGPVGCPLLIGHSPQQDSVLGGELFHHGLPHLLIEVLLPYIRRFHNTIQCDKQPCDDFSHDEYSFNSDLRDILKAWLV